VISSALNTNVLSLHTSMMSTDVRTLMESRPNNKKELSARYEALDTTTQQSGTILLDALKAMVGKIKVEPATSQLKVAGMSGLLATAWDWRRAPQSKNKQRDYLPVAQAIMVEMDYVQTYREELLKNPYAACLRRELEETILSCERPTQMALVSHQTSSGGKVLNTGVAKKSAYWDGIQIPQQNEAGDATGGKSTMKQLLRIKKEQQLQQQDRDGISKIVQQLTSVGMAKLSKGANSHVASEVADAINALINVSTTTGSRLMWGHSMRFEGIRNQLS
jgi:hypothetical protein